ncbi:MAG TPA: ABC transporter permease [Steroidobacteraceae bacterium]|nr:ABC transporter permease [Steroidobacteraceae bacterium]
MILLIALGVAVTVTTFALLRAVSSNPFAAKAHRLFTPQIDNHGPDYVKSYGIDPVLTLRDVEALRAHDRAHLQAAIYQISLSLVPTDTTIDALEANGYAVTVDYFQMLDVPFQFGSAWSKAADKEGSNEVVIGNDLNQKVFHGANSVGQEIRLDGHTYRISGVLAPWNPLPRFYAYYRAAFDRHSPQLFLPFRQALILRIPTAGGSYGESFPIWDMRSEISFISYWVELPDSAAAAHYRNFLHAYADEQRAAGRFQWPANVALRDQEEWLNYQHVVPPEARISFVVALGLLLVCAVNTVGLLLARFMRRSSDIGVRRALGGSRSAILFQYLTEAAVVGLAGGLLGAVLTVFFVSSLGLVFPVDVARLAHVTWPTLLQAPIIALCMVLLAAAYPILRACRVEPGWQLKSS